MISWAAANCFASILQCRSVSKIEPEAPGVLLRLGKRREFDASDFLHGLHLEQRALRLTAARLRKVAGASVVRLRCARLLAAAESGDAGACVEAAFDSAHRAAPAARHLPYSTVPCRNITAANAYSGRLVLCAT